MRVGILGGGQLCRMLAEAGENLGIEVLFLDPSPDACARDVADQLCGDYENTELLERLASETDVITYEFENIPLSALTCLESHARILPSLNALQHTQDRLIEKQLFESLRIPLPAFAAVDDLESLQTAIGITGLPAVLKTRRFGYDGKGQVVIRSEADMQSALESIAHAPAVLEAMVDFDREISILASREKSGQTVYYPLSENTHEQGILMQSISRADDPATQAAIELIDRLLQELDYCGTMALELFQQGDQLLANEYAPRVHNSGHWTIEGCRTSQFENHLRAIIGLPLGDASTTGPTAMLNCIGSMPIRTDSADIHWHDYGKQARAGRKVGHVTLQANDMKDLEKNLAETRSLLIPT